MLKLRKRGRVYHIRGTVRVGRKVRIVKEHSTGADRRTVADAYRARLEHEIQQELLHGVDGRASTMTVADCLASYLARPEGLGPIDVWYVREINEYMGDYALTATLDGWAEFRKARCSGRASATVDRFRAVLVAALNHGCGERGVPAPSIPTIKFNNQRIRYLTPADADALHNAYPKHVIPIVSVLRFQGARTQEALQLEWAAVDMRARTLFFERTKNDTPRTIAMYPRVAAEIAEIWERRGQPAHGHVFLNRVGKPYGDTRDYALPGGNPLSKAHKSALSKVTIRPNGGPDFRPHDWRHHWASWMVMNGVDLLTIQKLGGWKDIRMLQRYAALSVEHLAEAVKRASKWARVGQGRDAQK